MESVSTSPPAHVNTPNSTIVRREATRFIESIEVALGVFTGLAIAFLVQQVDDVAHAEFQLNSVGYASNVPQTMTSVWNYTQSSLWATVLLIVLFVAYLIVPRVFFRKRYRLLSVFFSVFIFVYWVLLLLSSMLTILPSANFNVSITSVTSTPAIQEASAALTQIYSFFYVTTFYIVAANSLVTAFILWIVSGIIADYGRRTWVLLLVLVPGVIGYVGDTVISLPTVIFEWGGPGALSSSTGPGRCLNCAYYVPLQSDFQAIYYFILGLFIAVGILSVMRASVEKGKDKKLDSALKWLEGHLNL